MIRNLRACRTLTFILLFTAAASGQESDKSPDEHCTFRIQVLDAESGADVWPASVKYFRQGENEPARVIELQENGEAVVSLPDGQWTVIASAKGYISAQGTTAIASHNHSMPLEQGPALRSADGLHVAARSGETYQLQFSLRKRQRGRLSIDVAADRTAVDPFVVLWKSGRRRPSALIDVEKMSEDLQLHEGLWYAAACAEHSPNGQRRATVAISNQVSGDIVATNNSETSFEIDPGSRVRLSITGAEAAVRTDDSSRLTVECLTADSGQWEKAQHAIVVMWQDFVPTSLTAFSAHDSADFVTHLAPGPWKIQAMIPGFAGNVDANITSTRQDTHRHTSRDRTNSSNQVALSVASAETYHVRFLFDARNEEDSAAPQPPPILAGATIHGHVVAEDSSGKSLGVVRDAEVELVGTGGRVLGRKLTDDSGYYFFDGVMPGQLEATISTSDVGTSTRDVQLKEDIGTHILDFIVVRSDNKDEEPPQTGGVRISVYEQTGTEKRRRTDATVIVWRGDDRRVLDRSDPLSGTYETNLGGGDWKVSATAPGLATEDDQSLTVTSGDSTEFELLLTAQKASRSTRALVSVLKRKATSKSAPPEVSFRGATVAEALLEPVPESELAGQAGSRGNSDDGT